MPHEVDLLGLPGGEENVEDSLILIGECDSALPLLTLATRRHIRHLQCHIFLHATKHIKSIGGPLSE